MIGDQVMDIVTALPPADGQPATEVGDEHAKECIHDEIVGDGKMSSIVRSEHDLMLFTQGTVSTCFSRCQSIWDPDQRTQNMPKKAADVMYHL